MGTTQGTPSTLAPPETETGRETSVAAGTGATRPGNIGLALSGGGVRAALFSLGVIIGLIETQYNRRIRCVTSVSGGSIVNAALAHGPRLTSFSSLEGFDPQASSLAASLAWRGAFAFDWRTLGSAVWYVAGVAARTIPPLIVGLAIFAENLRKDWNLNLADFPYRQVPWLTVGGILLASVAVAVILSRGRLQEVKYQSVIRAVAASSSGGATSLNISDWGAPSDATNPGVQHVLVATDLLSGEPVYFSSQFVYCRPYGWIDPKEKDIGTAEALYSSAAFPAVFPPRKLKVRKLSFQNGAMPGALPRTARLVDGGVYNNLGTDWFVFLDKQLPSASKLWPTGELKVEMPDIRLKNVIVVNAGAPSQRVRWLGPLTLARIMSVLYDNTVRPRVQALQAQDQPLIDIAESPMQLAKRLVHLPDDEGRRAQKLVNLFSDREEQFWADFVQETAGTRTKLTSAGPREGARLMLHGYLSSLVLLHVRFGAPLPEPIRGEQYFLTLVRRPSTPSSAVKQPAVGRAKESGRT